MEFRTLTPERTNILNGMRKECVENYEPKNYVEIEKEKHTEFCLIYVDNNCVGYIAFAKLLKSFDVKELFVKQSYRKQKTATKTLNCFVNIFGECKSKLEFVKKVVDKK